MEVSKIYEGWKNHLFPKKHLKEIIEKTHKERMSICLGCDWHSKNRPDYKSLRKDGHCTLCGCTDIAKTKCLSCSCPDSPKQWEAIVTEEQFNKMKNE